MTVGQGQAVPVKRMLPPMCLLIAVVALAALHLLLPLRQILVSSWRLLGLAPLLAGVVLNLVADRQFKQHGTTVKPFERSTAMIASGVYRVSRNPMYLGFVLILLGLGILLGSLTPFVVVPVFALWMDRAFIRVEEQMLREAFPGAWVSYAAKVRRWI